LLRIGRLMVTWHARNASVAWRAGRPGAARGGRQRDDFAAQLGQAVSATEKPDFIGQYAVVAGTDHQLGLRRTEGEFVVDVALPIGHHRHACRAGGDQFGGVLGRFQPALAFLVLERTFAAQFLLAAAPGVEAGVHEAEQSPVGGIDGDRWMQVPAALVTIVAQRRGVLDHENMPTGDPLRGVPAGGFDHFTGGYPFAAQEAAEADLTGPVTAEGTHPNPGLSDLDQAFLQEGASSVHTAISKRTERILHPESLCHNEEAAIQRFVRGARKRCVHAVGSGRRIIQAPRNLEQARIF
jgi:hypothetical protein